MDIFKQIGVSLVVQGLKTCKKALYLQPKEVSFGVFKDAFIRVGLGSVSTSEQDLRYHITSWDKYEESLDLAYEILKNFPWTPEFFDCDNRSMFVTTLLAIFGINCGRLHGNVYNSETGDRRYLHWFNGVVDDKGDLYIFDADFGGGKTKVEKGKDILIGKNRYVIDQAIFN
jgi:hypothetical protein